MDRFDLSAVQAQAILEMQLRRLQGLEREKIEAEYQELLKKIEYFRRVLSDEALVLSIVKEESLALRDKYADERRTGIEVDYDEIDLEDLIEPEDCVITCSHHGYIKRQPVSVFRAQHRGGRGVSAMATREEDFVEDIFIANTHSYLLCFTDQGRIYRLKGYQVPEAGRAAKGTNLVNLLPLEQGEKVNFIIHLDQFDEERCLTMATRGGTIKRTALSEYNTARKGGLIAIRLEEGDSLAGVCVTGGEDTLLLATRRGKAIHFKESDVRRMGRPAFGVRGIELEEGDEVIGLSIVSPGATVLTVTENGYGKRSDPAEYKILNRGGKGILNYHLTEKTGPVAGVQLVQERDDVMLVTDDGVVIRMAVAEVPVYTRVTQGVRVMRLDEGVRLVTVTRADQEESVEADDGAGAVDGDADLAESEAVDGAEVEAEAGSVDGAVDEGSSEAGGSDEEE
ncbi:MAG: DNA gyrase subunit A, partial [Clostridia bacterium]|nr:DNA gyrase subunit A [Clostridia bacterium]